MSAAAPDLRGRMCREQRLAAHAETTEFLRRQKIANVGTVDRNGWPYAVPLVYIYEGGDLLYLHTGDHQGHFLTKVHSQGEGVFRPSYSSTGTPSQLLFGRPQEAE